MIFVLEQFLRQTFPGWCVPDAVVHVGRVVFVQRPDDGIAIDRHNVCVLQAEHETWLRGNHDPGDEDRSF